METIPILPVGSRLADLAEQIRALSESEDPKRLHEMRVAAGRLSVWLELGGRHALRDDLRRLRRSAAPARDIDVMSAMNRSPGRNEELAARRDASLAGLRQELASSRVPALLAALHLVPPPLAGDALHVLQELERRAVRAGEKLQSDPDDPAALHRLRRRVRRLRYALDWLGRDSAAVKELQDTLGHVNDLSVEREDLAAHANRNGSSDHRGSVERELVDGHARALEAWRAFARQRNGARR